MFLGVDWENIRNVEAPIIPHLYIKEPTNFKETRNFEDEESKKPFFEKGEKKVRKTILLGFLLEISNRSSIVAEALFCPSDQRLNLTFCMKRIF